ncbi:MAG TPA: hypothetical protein VF885_17320 [Arthrobacter sp.]
MRPKYALPTDWDESDFTEGEAPADVAKLLNRASLHIDGMLINAVYPVDEDGYPEELDTLETLKDATLAQAAYWLETGDVSGAAAGAQSMGIGSVSIGGLKSAGDTARSKDSSRDAPEAVKLLRLAGLYTATVGRR